MNWRDLKPFQVGRSINGHDTFDIPLKPDAEGMIGRECINAECKIKYYKISVNIVPDYIEQDLSQISLHCPYCGQEAHMQHLHTRSQIDYMFSLVKRDAIRSVGSRLSEMARDFNRNARGGLFSITMDVEPGSLPMIRRYVEDDLRRIVACDECGGRYSVYGIARYCPWCGTSNVNVHFDRNVEMINILLSKVGPISNEDPETGYLLMGDCLENCVSLYEGFLKQIYGDRIREKYGPAEANEKLDSIKNALQNLGRASRLFDEFDVEIFRHLDVEELEFLQIQFAKRHILTHNLGLVDKKYLEQVSTWLKPGQEVPLKTEEISRTLGIIKKIIMGLI